MSELPWLESGPVALIVRASAILIVAFALHRSLRGASALSRHALWATVMIGLLALPLLQLRMPRFGIPGWRGASPSIDASSAMAPRVRSDEDATQLQPAMLVASSPHAGQRRTTADMPVRATSIPWHVLLVLGWGIGGIAVLVPLVVGVRRARRLVREATPVHNRRMLARLEHLRRVVGVRRKVLLAVSERVQTPMAWGYWRAVILLPLHAADWTDDRFDAVLVHELVHIRRGDPMHQATARIASAWYWFHPLVWRAARCAAVAREQACDDAVLRFGTRPSHYARHLMELAEHGATMTSMPALARLHHPNLEDRVMTILRHVPARRSPWRAMLAVTAMAASTLAIAAVGPVSGQRPAPPVPPLPAAQASVAPLAPPAPRSVPHAPNPSPVPPEPVPPIPLAPAPPTPPMPPADCATESGRGVVVERSGARGQPTRMIRRNLADGRAICLAVRGALPERFVLSPLGNLPTGVVVTLEASREGTAQRMEITGGSQGNVHRWLVNGSEHPFNAEAREWRDAMLAVLSLGFEQSQVQRAVASHAATAMRVRAEEMAAEAQVMSSVQADRITEQAAALDDQARSIEAQRTLAEVAAERLHERAARLDAERPARVEAAVAAARVSELHERAMVDSRRMQEQRAAVAEVNARVRESSERMRVEERALADRARVLQAERQRLTDVQRERAAPRVREIDARLEPLERRLKEIIERIEPR